MLQVLVTLDFRTVKLLSFISICFTRYSSEYLRLTSLSSVCKTYVEVTITSTLLLCRKKIDLVSQLFKQFSVVSLTLHLEAGSKRESSRGNRGRQKHKLKIAKHGSLTSNQSRQDATVEAHIFAIFEKITYATLVKLVLYLVNFISSYICALYALRIVKKCSKVTQLKKKG